MGRSQKQVINQFLTLRKSLKLSEFVTGTINNFSIFLLFAINIKQGNGFVRVLLCLLLMVVVLGFELRALNKVSAL
jgi:hypothetical protein